jgi:hypothetical protein
VILRLNLFLPITCARKTGSWSARAPFPGWLPLPRFFSGRLNVRELLRFGIAAIVIWLLLLMLALLIRECRAAERRIATSWKFPRGFKSIIATGIIGNCRQATKSVTGGTRGPAQDADQSVEIAAEISIRGIIERPPQLFLEVTLLLGRTVFPIPLVVNVDHQHVFKLGMYPLAAVIVAPLLQPMFGANLANFAGIYHCELLRKPKSSQRSDGVERGSCNEGLAMIPFAQRNSRERADDGKAECAGEVVLSAPA